MDIDTVIRGSIVGNCPGKSLGGMAVDSKAADDLR